MNFVSKAGISICGLVLALLVFDREPTSAASITEAPVQTIGDLVRVLDQRDVVEAERGRVAEILRRIER